MTRRVMVGTFPQCMKAVRAIKKYNNITTSVELEPLPSMWSFDFKLTLLEHKVVLKDYIFDYLFSRFANKHDDLHLLIWEYQV